MKIEEYVKQNVIIHDLLLDYLDGTEDKIPFQKLINMLKTQKILEKRESFQALLILLSKLSRNHHRIPGFITKIYNFLLFLKVQIEQTFSNLEIFNIFQNSKLIILFLIENNILVVNEEIANLIYYKRCSYYEKELIPYHLFFYKEINEYLSEEQKQTIDSSLGEFDVDIFENFDEKRRIGENDNKICEIIRNDSIKLFARYFTTKLLAEKVPFSIFETNPFLMKDKLIFIEYAAFFGSIKIFLFLSCYLRETHIPKRTWICAIHGRNSKIIHLLFDDNISLSDDLYVKCFNEAIKCHHNDIAIYFEKNFGTKNLLHSICYLNYLFFSKDFNEIMISYKLVKYNCFTLIKLLLKNKRMIINFESILKFIIFYNVFINLFF